MRRIWLGLALALWTTGCGDDDSTGPSSGPSGPGYALGGGFSVVRAPDTQSSFEFLHSSGIGSIEMWTTIGGLSSLGNTLCTNRMNASQAGFLFEIASNGSPSSDSHLHLQITNASGGVVVDARSAPGSIGFDPRGWRHLAVVSNGTDVRFYIDGAEQVVARNSAAGGTAGASGASLYLRGTPTGSGFTTNNHQGDLDELRLWTTARTASEIQGRAHRPLSNSEIESAGSDLAGYWRFDDFESLTVPADGRDDIRDFSSTFAHLDCATETRLIVSDAF